MIYSIERKVADSQFQMDDLYEGEKQIEAKVEKGIFREGLGEIVYH